MPSPTPIAIRIPPTEGPGSWGRVKGLWHGHIGWLFTVNKIDWSRHTRDWLQDRRVMKINGQYFTVVLAGVVIPGVVGGLATQSVHGFVGGILWGGSPDLRTRPCDLGGELARPHDR